MFDRTGQTTGGIEIIFIVLLGCLFLCQTLGKLIMWLVGRFRYTAFTGQDIIEELKDKNYLEDAKIKTVSFNPLSSFYSYNKKKDEFVISKRAAKLTNAAVDAYSLQAMAYANEQNHHMGMNRWQLIGDALLSIVPYLFLIATLLIIYLPVNPNNGKDDWWSSQARYDITVQVLCIVGWVVMLVTLFWWMSIVQDMSASIEDLTKQLDDKNILHNMDSYLKVCSYIPFSFRTVI